MSIGVYFVIVVATRGLVKPSITTLNVLPAARLGRFSNLTIALVLSTVTVEPPLGNINLFTILHVVELNVVSVLRKLSLYTSHFKASPFTNPAKLESFN